MSRLFKRDLIFTQETLVMQTKIICPISNRETEGGQSVAVPTIKDLYAYQLARILGFFGKTTT